MLGRIRAFFAAREFMEVETPALSRAAATDPALGSFSVCVNGGLRYLHTSPEFPMKRLLAAGSGDIYQICRVFRAGEIGRHHNPEFALLEWYRLGFDHHALMTDVEELLREVLSGFTTIGSANRLSYRDAFTHYAELDPLTSTTEDLRTCAASHAIQTQGALDRDQWLDLLLSHVVAPALPEGRFTFIYDYPASQAALARVRSGEPPVAERFEVFWGALELANGFHELIDPAEQRERFEREQRARRAADLSVPALDERLLKALAHGLPDCAGVALGLDRLTMVAAGADSIAEVTAFPWDRA